MSHPTRPMVAADIPSVRRLLNEIIAIGGTTAMEAPLTMAQVTDWYLQDPTQYGSHVVLDADGAVAGFQWLGRHDGLPATCGDIATFTRRNPAVRGAGRALFAVTKAAALDAGLTEINATIRADNVPGLGYYTKMGFVDHGRTAAVPLKDGTPVDRIHKRYRLASN